MAYNIDEMLIPSTHNIDEMRTPNIDGMLLPSTPSIVEIASKAIDKNPMGKIKQLGSTNTDVFGASAPNTGIYDIGRASMKGNNLYFGDKLATMDQTNIWARANPELAQQIGGVQFDSNNNQVGEGFNIPGGDKGIGFLGEGGYGQLALGAGQLGLGVLNYLDNEKTAKKNRELVDQQIATNRYVLDKTTKSDAGLTNAYNTVYGDKYGKLA
jgi:hypothetical protein